MPSSSKRKRTIGLSSSSKKPKLKRQMTSPRSQRPKSSLEIFYSAKGAGAYQFNSRSSRAKSFSLRASPFPVSVSRPAYSKVQETYVYRSLFMAMGKLVAGGVDKNIIHNYAMEIEVAGDTWHLRLFASGADGIIGAATNKSRNVPPIVIKAQTCVQPAYRTTNYFEVETALMKKATRLARRGVPHLPVMLATGKSVDRKTCMFAMEKAYGDPIELVNSDLPPHKNNPRGQWSTIVQSVISVYVYNRYMSDKGHCDAHIANYLVFPTGSHKGYWEYEIPGLGGFIVPNENGWLVIYDFSRTGGVLCSGIGAVADLYQLFSDFQGWKMAADYIDDGLAKVVRDVSTYLDARLEARYAPGARISNRIFKNKNVKFDPTFEEIMKMLLEFGDKRGYTKKRSGDKRLAKFKLKS